MAGRSWEPTKRGARDLNRWLSRGKTVYTSTIAVTNFATGDGRRIYPAHTFDRRSPITGQWMTGHLSVEGLLGQYGTVYEQPPAAV